jgi:predicted CopG family antitoxin
VSQGTILIRNETRERLKHLGIKGQTYDDLINELIETKTKNSAQNPNDGRLSRLPSTESPL